MTNLPIDPVVLPSDLKGQENGKLDASLLTDVGTGKLHHVVAKAWMAMVAAAKADGIDLKPTSSADTYRTYTIQLITFQKRYSRIPRIGQTPKVWDGKKYWLKKGYAGSAVPGTSNHGLGLAIDVELGGKTLDWLLANAAKFGFSWEDQSENWHIHYTQGDKLTAAVTKPVKAAKPKVAAPKATPASKPAAKPVKATKPAKPTAK